MPITATYREEGWLYDLAQVRGALLVLLVALCSFGGLVAVYATRPPYHGPNVTAFYGFDLAVIAGVTSAAGVVIAVSTAVDNTHRVRKLAWACAGVSAATFVCFCVFIGLLST